MDSRRSSVVDGFVRFLSLSTLWNLFLVSLLFTSVCAQCQTATFTGAQSTITSFTSSISQVAVDGAGEMFTVESDGSKYSLTKILPSGSKTVLDGNFPFSPQAVAVNPAGTSLYFIHSGANCGSSSTYEYVAKTTITGNTASATTDLPCSFSLAGIPGWTGYYTDPQDLKVDAAGNVYVADFGLGGVWKIPSGSNTPTQMLELTIGQPYDIAISADGKTIYFTYMDYRNNSAYTIGSAPVSGFSSSSVAVPPTNIATGLTSIQSGLQVDSSGVLYVGGTLPSGDSVVFKVSGGALTPVTPPSPSSLNGFGADSAGKLYTSGVDSSGNPVISDTSFTGIGIGSSNIGSKSAVLPLQFYFNTPGTLGGIDVLTDGVSGLEFANVGSGSCNTTTAFAAAATCTVNVALTPAYAGLRKGAVVLKNAGGTVIATVYIYGTGWGPQVAFAPATESIIKNNLTSPARVAVDAAGNVYFADSSSVQKLTLSGGNYAQTVVASSLSSPTGVAIDGGGNVYIADSGNNRVLREAPSGSSYLQSIMANAASNGLNSPSGVAVDGSGNIYIADKGGNRVLKETFSTSGYGQSVVATGLSSPTGVAVDGVGNVYIADSGNNRILNEAPSTSGYTQSVIANNTSNGLSNPSDVAVSGTGNVYIADSGNNRILKEVISGGNYTQSVVADTANGLINPAGIAVAATGTVFIADRNNNRVLKEDFVNPSLSFATTLIGGTSSDSPKTLTVANIGNAALNITVPSVDHNPSISANFALTGFPTCGQLSPASPSDYVLAAASSCTYLISFNPTTWGDIAGSLVVTDNASPGSQTVALLGKGLSPVTLSPTTLPDGTFNSTYTATVSATGGTAPYAYSVSGGLPPGISLSQAGVLSGTPSAAGTYTFTITATDSTNSPGTQDYTFIVKKATATVTLSDLTPTYTGSALAPTATTAPSGLALSFAYTQSGVTATPVKAGSYAVTATINDNNYQGTASDTLVIGKATATVALSNLSQTYTGLALAPAASTTPSGLTVSFGYTQSGVTATPIGAGSYAVTATINDNNYQGTASDTLVIGKATATVALSNLSQTYTGSALAPTAATVPPGLTVSFSYSQSGVTATPTGAGSYAVTATVSDNNYQGSTINTLVIGKATATVTLSNLSQTYTGSALAATAATAPSGLNVSLAYTQSGVTATPIGAGSYAVAVTINDNNYQGTANDTLVIGKATATVALSNLSQTYTGSTLAATAVTAPSGLNVSLAYTLSGVTATPIGAGSYAVTATINDNNYQGSTINTLVIGKATANVTLSNLSQTYTGSALAPTVATTPSGLNVSLAYTLSGVTATPIGAGSYAVAVTINDNNYQGTANDTLVIGKATATVALSNLSQTYTGSALAPTATTTPSGLAVSLGYTLSAAAATPIGAGSYAVTATINDNNYQGTASDTLVVGKATATVTLSNLSQTYTGSALAATAATAPSGLNVSLAYTLSGVTATPVGAGSYAVTATINDNNYQGSNINTLVIGKATATVALSNLSQTYTGSALAPTASTVPSGLAVSFGYTQSGVTVAPVGAGSYAVAATITDNNYQGSITNALVIGKATLSITPSDASIAYGSTAPTLVGTVSGVASGDGIGITYSTNATQTSSVGTYDIKPVVNDPNNKLGNYSVSATNGVLTVTPAPLVVTSANATTTYNAAIPPMTGTLTGVVNSDPITATYSTTAVQGSNAGTYPITATLVATPAVLANYALSNTPGVLTVGKAPGTSVTLSTSNTTDYYGQSLTFTAHITNLAGTPGGSVAFSDGGVLLGNVTLTNGTAAYTTSTLSVGTHTLSAEYTGSANYVGAASSALPQAVLTPAISIGGSGTGSSLGSLTLIQGGSASAQFKVGSMGTLSSAVSLTCSGLPSGLVCQLSPSTINASDLPATVTITVSTASSKLQGSNKGGRALAHLEWVLAMMLPGMLIMSRGRNFRMTALAIIAFVLLLGMVACGGGSSNKPTPVTPMGAYSATITATSNGATAITSTFNVVVQ